VLTSEIILGGKRIPRIEGDYLFLHTIRVTLGLQINCRTAFNPKSIIFGREEDLGDNEVYPMPIVIK
jgi:hypothetical protein